MNEKFNIDEFISKATQNAANKITELIDSRVEEIVNSEFISKDDIFMMEMGDGKITTIFKPGTFKNKGFYDPEINETKSNHLLLANKARMGLIRVDDVPERTIENLTRNNLVKLVRGYDKYIIDWLADEDTPLCGSAPVCISEFFYNEFQEENELNDNDFIGSNRDIACSIMDEFEGFLTERNIVIPNDNREDDETGASLYGEDYYNMEDMIVQLLDDVFDRR